MPSALSQSDRYAMPSVAIHWLTLILIAAVYLLVETLDFIPKDDTALRTTVRNLHKSLGLTVFIIVWIRLIFRMIYPSPPIEPQPPVWQRLAAKLVHIALYGVMIANPIAGYLMSNANGRPVALFGLALPALISENKPLAEQIFEVHETLGNAGLILIGIHAAASLFHHFVQKDNTLVRMLPMLRRTG